MRADPIFSGASTGNANASSVVAKTVVRPNRQLERRLTGGLVVGFVSFDVESGR